MQRTRLLILAFSLAVCAKGQNVRQILASGYSSGFYPLTFNEDTGKKPTPEVTSDIMLNLKQSLPPLSCPKIPRVNYP